MEKLVLSITELADVLGISRSKAYELTNVSGFPTVRIGKRIVVPIAALNEWMAKGGTIAG